LDQEHDPIAQYPSSPSNRQYSRIDQPRNLLYAGIVHNAYNEYGEYGEHVEDYSDQLYAPDQEYEPANAYYTSSSSDHHHSRNGKPLYIYRINAYMALDYLTYNGDAGVPPRQTASQAQYSQLQHHPQPEKIYQRRPITTYQPLAITKSSRPLVHGQNQQQRGANPRNAHGIRLRPVSELRMLRLNFATVTCRDSLYLVYCSGYIQKHIQVRRIQCSAKHLLRHCANLHTESCTFAYTAR